MESVVATEQLAISGFKLPAENFRVQESVGHLELRWIEALLAGQIAAYRIRDFLGVVDQRRIANNFWQSTSRTPRYGEGTDGVEAYFVGASHIEKTTPEYLDDASRYKDAVAALYRDATDPLDRLRSILRNGPGTVRAAQHRGRPAGDAKAVYWNNTGEFLLLPHEDLAQLADPRQAGFEIQQVERVLAANFYAEMPGAGGELKVWNVEPDAVSRTRLGLEHSGFPYPARLLDAHSHLVIDLKAGDLVLLNGNLIHAVLGGTCATARQRLLITCFMGRVSTDELVWWT